MKITCDKNGNVTIIFYAKDCKYNTNNLSDLEKTRLLYLLDSLSGGLDKKEQKISVILNNCSFQLKEICNNLLSSNDIEKDITILKNMLL